MFLMPLSLPETAVSIFFGALPKRDKKFAAKKKYFFRVIKKFPQQIENTREIIENMSEII